ARPREDRAAYAGIIADFATRAPRFARPALAAPMACPVLGDKSIIHRLRGLSMTDISTRRRFAARTLLAGAVLALPLTASISYAAQDALPAPPPAPPSAQAVATVAAPAAPAAPLAPQSPPAADAPDAPLPPEAPEARAALHARGDGEHRVVVRRIERDGEAPRVERHVERHVIRNIDRKMTAEERAEFEREMAEMREELHRELGENGEMRGEIHQAVAEARAEAAHAHAMAPRVVKKCKDKDSPVTSETGRDGRTTLFVCESFGDRVALKALRNVRSTIAHERNLSREERAEALRELDKEIARLSE
ncbi:MAG: M56 family metallopeptidase, partial [Qipengyuania sp.]